MEENFFELKRDLSLVWKGLVNIKRLKKIPTSSIQTVVGVCS